jgi:hypothetical protein
MCVAAVPNAHFPPPAGVLHSADLVAASLDELTPETLLAADERRARSSG